MNSSDPFELNRFLEAQDGIFDTALDELRAGSKRSHWMWFIFPQFAGLGPSATAQLYGIASMKEAQAYLAHTILGRRLTQCVEALLPWAGKMAAHEILGAVDALKLRSSLTLFDRVAPGGLFAQALDSFYGGVADERTLALLDASR